MTYMPQKCLQAKHLQQDLHALRSSSGFYFAVSEGERARDPLSVADTLRGPCFGSEKTCSLGRSRCLALLYPVICSTGHRLAEGSCF